MVLIQELACLLGNKKETPPRVIRGAFFNGGVRDGDAHRLFFHGYARTDRRPVR